MLKKSVIGASIVSPSGLGQASHEGSGVVDFDDLSPDAKRIFKQLRTFGPMHGATDVEADTVHPFFLNDEVRYQGELHDYLRVESWLPEKCWSTWPKARR